MAFDKFLIAPINTGLQRDVKPFFNTFALSGIISKYTKGCLMKLRKDAIDITGQIFGDLTALRTIKPGKYRGVKWLCLCNCGNETIAFGGHLRAGKRVSCGCRSSSRIFETGINRLVSTYRSMAKRRKWMFQLTRDHLRQLVLDNCHYCGNEPFNELKRLKSKKTQLKYNGIDRVDPLKGYLPDNVVSCCYYCNHAKLDLTFDEWKQQLLKIFKHQGFSNGI